MVGYLPHCTFALNPRAASIDTPLHAYVPRAHVDHMHADAIIAIAASANSQALTAEVFGDEIGWLPWRRPGYELGLWLEKFARENPQARGCVLESHGLFTWGDDAERCYETTLDVINRAIAWLETRTDGRPGLRRRRRTRRSPAEERRARRGAADAGDPRPRLGRRADGRALRRPAGGARIRRRRRDMAALAALGTSCPDHFLRTKIRPLVVPFDPAAPDVDATIAGLGEAVAAYRADYAGLLRALPACRTARRCAIPTPSSTWCRGSGMITFAKDKATARISGEFYVNAINVMRGASAISEYRGLPEQEAFDIEYWLLEEAKLQRMPKPKGLAGRIAIVTGGAGGIGSATAERFLREGACVRARRHRRRARSAETAAALAARHGSDVVRDRRMDVTSEAAVAAAYRRRWRSEFGGCDILVSNAGIASSAPVEETTLALWNRNMDILVDRAISSSRARPSG